MIKLQNGDVGIDADRRVEWVEPCMDSRRPGSSENSAGCTPFILECVSWRALWKANDGGRLCPGPLYFSHDLRPVLGIPAA